MERTRALAAALVACVAVATAGCGSDGADSAGATELTVFAASSLSAAFDRIGERFEAAHGGTSVTFNFGSSGDLAPQIGSEGTADVFASASPTDMDEVQRAVGVNHRTEFARNRLVVITPPDDPGGVSSLRDLARSGVQVVLAAEGVPVGDYARQALRSAGIEREVLANVVSSEEDDAALVARIAAGEADAAIVYASDVTSRVAPRVRAVRIPAAVNVVATYPIAVIDGAAHPWAAHAFVRSVMARAGQATLRRFGFLPVAG